MRSPVVKWRVRTCVALVVCGLLLATGCAAARTPPTLQQLSADIDLGQEDEVETILLDRHARDPDDAGVLALLARIAYLRAVEGRASLPGIPEFNWDRAHMEAARMWAEKATTADASHANAWIVAAQIELAYSRIDESLKMLARAEAIDPASPKLRLRKGEALRARSTYIGDRSVLGDAAREYRLVIVGEIDNGDERKAASALAEIHRERGEPVEAHDYLTRAIVTAEGRERANLFDHRAQASLHAGDADRALADSRAALAIADFGVARETLATALLLKAGPAVRDGTPEMAVPLIAEALGLEVNLPGVVTRLAWSPKTLPGVYAVLGPELGPRGGSDLVTSVIGESAHFITASDLQRLHALGVGFDAVDSIRGTLLHRAIAADNVDAVASLLALGVDASVRAPNGRTALEASLVGTSPKRREIRRLVAAATDMPKGWKAPDVDLPVEGRWYRATRRIGVESGPSRPIEAGQVVRGGTICTLLDSTDQCMTFRAHPGDRYLTVRVPLADLGDLVGLEEIEAPAATSP